jgi:hypothetical protein
MQLPGPAQQPAKKEVVKVAAPAAHTARKFDTPQQGADALVKAAADFDISSLIQIFGPTGSDVVFSGEFGQDRQNAAEFTAQAREKMSVSMDPKNANRAFIIVGKQDWPFPVPLVKSGAKWSFDAVAGRDELFHRQLSRRRGRLDGRQRLERPGDVDLTPGSLGTDLVAGLDPLGSVASVHRAALIKHPIDVRPRQTRPALDHHGVVTSREEAVVGPRPQLIERPDRGLSHDTPPFQDLAKPGAIRGWLLRLRGKC